MSEYGRWRENEDRIFDAWWQRFGSTLSRYARDGNEYLRTTDGGYIIIQVRDEAEREMARVAAREAWHIARADRAP